jgi:uncharacterized Zn-finger protein
MKQNFKLNLNYILNFKELKCILCFKKFKSKYKLDRHYSVHTSPIPCYFCGKFLKTNSRPDLARQHLKFCTPFKEFIEEKHNSKNINCHVKNYSYLLTDPKIN